MAKKCRHGLCMKDGVPEFDGLCPHCYDHNEAPSIKSRKWMATKPKGVTRNNSNGFFWSTYRSRNEDNSGGIEVKKERRWWLGE